MKATPTTQLSQPSLQDSPSPPRQGVGGSRKVPSDNCFDFLRLFAAVSVMVSHTADHLNLPVLGVTPAPHAYGFFDGVPLFFILSGFLVYRSYERCAERGLPTRYYLINRYLRIAPAIYAYVAATTIILLAAGAISWATLATAPYWEWIAINIALVPKISPSIFDHFGTGSINGSLWTIPVEFGFYLAIPAFYLFEKRYGYYPLIGLMAIIAAVGIVIAAYLEAMSPILRLLVTLTFVPYLIFFALGIFWSRMWSKVSHGIVPVVICAIVYGAIRFFNVFGLDAVSPGLHLRGSISLWYCLSWSLPFSYLVLWVGYYGPKVFQTITQRIGDLSYGVYIWHMVVVNLALYLGLPQLWRHIPGATQFFVIATSFIMAGLSWWLVEKPVLRLKPYTSRRAGQITPPGINQQLPCSLAQRTW